MRWKNSRRSTNIEDRRGRSGGPRLPGGAGMKIGGGAGLLIVLLGLFLGQDLTGLISGGAQAPSQAPTSGSSTLPANDENAQFTSAILASTEDVWAKLFRESGQQYQPAKLVLFDNGVNSACGYTPSAAGPFYCPGDYQVYIDLGFYNELHRMGAGGDFAAAYVLAHEIGHHVQNLLGVSMAVQRRQREVSKVDANRLSVLAELQADCYAGVWAHHAHKDAQMLEYGDLEEGMNAAAKIGDDALMKKAGRDVNPHAFTHGSSEQRQTWLYRGLESGNPDACDTFGSGT